MGYERLAFGFGFGFDFLFWLMAVALAFGVLAHGVATWGNAPLSFCFGIPPPVLAPHVSCLGWWFLFI